jgi:single-strand DNA-binding protein
MHANNLVVLRGRLSSEPKVRALPSGVTLVNLEVTTDVDGVSVSVPVVLEASDSKLASGDTVVVAGQVRRRYFRAGGITQSRTEVVASSVVKAGNRRTVARSLEKAAALLLE